MTRILNPEGRDLAMTIAAHIKALVWVNQANVSLDSIQVACAEKPCKLASKRDSYFLMFIACTTRSWQVHVSSIGWAVTIDGRIVDNLEQLTAYVIQTLCPPQSATDQSRPFPHDGHKPVRGD